MCGNRAIMKQSHEEQTYVATSAVLGPAACASQLYQTTSTVSSYGHRQSTVVAAMLIITGSLSILISIAEITTRLTYGSSFEGAMFPGCIICAIVVSI